MVIETGLNRCGKSCRLRWLNYLRPDIRHGDFTDDEDYIIYALYNNIGSKYVQTHLSCYVFVNLRFILTIIFVIFIFFNMLSFFVIIFFSYIILHGLITLYFLNYIIGGQ